MPLLLYQLPPTLSYNLPAYRAIATDPVPVALGGAMLALVLLGLRTLFGSIAGRDHLAVHITGRLIPATFLAVAYPVVIVRGIGLLNSAAAAIGPQALAGMLAFPQPPNLGLTMPYAVLWLLLVFMAVRLLLRLASSLFRFLVALVFGPLAIILWAIPQTEWITWLWLRELVGWGTSPLLVVVALALAIPLAAGQAGFPFADWHERRVQPKFNIAPSQDILTIMQSPKHQPEAQDATWGVAPHWLRSASSKPPINARAESVATSGLFRGALARTRCLIVATGYYEWRAEPGGGGKTPCTSSCATASPSRSPASGHLAKMATRRRDHHDHGQRSHALDPHPNAGNSAPRGRVAVARSRDH